MELLLTIILFAAAIVLLSLGIIFKGNAPHAGCCSSRIQIDKESVNCGACPSKEAEICKDGDKDRYATLAQLGHPARKHKFQDRSSAAH